ncbi:MAG: hypothetical protein II684_06640 [Treponema sp.]|nr:hypothetical protein [Treponema sp.]
MNKKGCAFLELCPSGFRLGAEAEITMKDWIATTYYMESVVVRFTGRILF